MDNQLRVMKGRLPTLARRSRPVTAMVFGVGSFAQSITRVLSDAGARASTYLTRNYGHFPPP